MDEPVATPRPPAPLFKPRSTTITNDAILSSSPAFGTPAYPIVPRQPRPAQPFAQQQNPPVSASVLPILLPPQILRPVAFRTLTKKHNLTLTSSGLGLLSTFVGKYCGNGWREDGLAEKVLDEIAKSWKRQGGAVIVEDGPDKKLTAILKSLEPCMSGGRVDMGRLSRTNSSVGGASLSRQNTSEFRPGVTRDDSLTSFGISGLDMDEHMDTDESETSRRDARNYLKVISAFDQPRLSYSVSKKSMETVSTPASLLPPVSHKIALFRDRYHLVHQRLMRNESFQTPSFSAVGPPTLGRSASNVATIQQAYKITPVANLLGRSGSAHLLLGLLVLTPTGDLAATDLSGSVALDLNAARPVPEDGSWFCPGMIVLIEGVYEEDGSNNSNLGGAGGVGGQIKGKFVADTIAGPPAERRDFTLGTGQFSKSDHVHTSVGAGFGWVDFLGTGSEKAVGQQMRNVQRRIIGRTGEEKQRTKIAILGECLLDSPRTLEAIRAVLTSYTASGEAADRPLTVVLMGNFVSVAVMAGAAKAGSIEYKEHFDGLASTLAEFPTLLSNTTFALVPGDNDPWASSFSAGAAVPLPRDSVPDLFTSRVRRVFAAANAEAGRKEGDLSGEAVWTTNPARLSLFGPNEEMVLLRDDITGRLRRSAVTFAKLNVEDDEDINMNNEPTTTAQNADVDSSQIDDTTATDPAVHEAASHVPKPPTSKSHFADSATARKLVKTILDQSHLAPFPLSTRPVLWDYGSSLSLYPLPTALVVADAETSAFALTYEGCHVMNPGRVLDELGKRKGVARWVEYDVGTRKGLVRDVRF